MIQKEKIEELLKLPAEERRQVLRLLQDSLLSENTAHPTSAPEEQSLAAKWLRSMAGRYSGGPGNTATRADDILRAEIDKHRGLTNN
jgi:hypothetical protein